MYEPSPHSVWRRRCERLLDLVFQPRCLGCGGPAAGGLRNLSLCPGCRRRLEPLEPPRCISCGRRGRPSWLAAGHRCPPCLSQPPPFDRLTAVWAYEPPLDACLRAFKFRRLTALAAPLGHALAHRLSHRGHAAALDLVVALPLHWRRRLVRGFDQALLLAREVAAHLDLPLLPALQRHRATHAQSGQPRARRGTNVARAFRVRRGVDVDGRRILLVDDVVTSGSTMAAAAQALRRAGASTVEAAAVARTPSRRRASGE